MKLPAMMGSKVHSQTSHITQNSLETAVIENLPPEKENSNMKLDYKQCKEWLKMNKVEKVQNMFLWHFRKI